MKTFKGHLVYDGDTNASGVTLGTCMHILRSDCECICNYIVFFSTVNITFLFYFAKP
jgi:hypothetical protein